MYTLTIETSKYDVTVSVELTRKNQVNAVADLLRRIVPANMFCNVRVKYNQYYMLSKFTYAELKQFTYKDLKDNPEIKEIYLDRGGTIL